MQSLELLSAIFLYQKMIAIKNLRKIIFISSKKFYFVIKVFKFLYILHPLFFPLLVITQEDSRN